MPTGDGRGVRKPASTSAYRDTRGRRRKGCLRPNAVAELINGQRRRSLAYQSPAIPYAALTVR